MAISTTNGGIILLNGASSAGKTSLVELLQEAMEEPFMNIGIDRIIYMMPPKINDWKGGPSERGFWWKEGVDKDNKKVYHLQMGDYAKLAIKSLQDMVLLLAKNGHNVVIDEVSLSSEYFQSWKEKLRDLCTLFVGVRTPLEVLEKREIARGDRIIGSARAQYYTVHEGAEYDLEVNTHEMSLNQCVQIIKDAFHCKRERMDAS